MEDENKNKLGLSNDDVENTNQVMSDLIDQIVKFTNGRVAEAYELDWAELKATLDFGNFIVSGIVYSNGLDLSTLEASILIDEDDDEDGVE